MTLVIENSDQSDLLKIPYDIFAVTSFITTAFYCVLYKFLLIPDNFPLHSFPGRIIGIAVLEGVDTVGRTHLYMYSLVLTGILAVGLLFLLEKAMNEIIPDNKFKKERFFLALLSIFGTANLIFGILIEKSVFRFNIYVIFCLIFCVIIFILARKYTVIDQSPLFPIFDDSAFVISLFLIPVPILFLIEVLEGNAFAFSVVSFITYCVIFSILVFAVSVICPSRFPCILDPKFREMLVNSYLPLYLYPISIPLTNELQYTLSQWISIDPKLLSLCLLVSLILICIIIFKIQINRNSPLFDPGSMLDNLSFPSLLAALSLYANYVRGGNLNQIWMGNLFEHGLTSVIVQQFFDFGKIPFINIVSPHGFWDLYCEILYSIVNGYQPLDCFLWRWITPVLLVLVGYFYFKEFSNGPIAFLIMILLPVSTILYLNNFFVLIAGIFFIRFWKNTQLKNYILFLFSILLCFFWRMEGGVAAVLAFFLIVVVLYYHILKKSPLQIWKEYSRYICSTIGIVGGIILLFISLCFFTHQAPVNAIQAMMNLFIINDPVGTYSVLFNTYDARVSLQYAVFPLFGLGLVLFFIWIACTRKEHITPQFLLIVFITITILFLSQRGIQRHSLVEGFAYYYFPLVACSIPLLWYRSKRVLSIILLILILFGGSFIAQYPLTSFHNDLTHNFFEFKTWENHESRIIIQESNIHEVVNLTEFLGETLRSDETYFDMSNLLMPYTLLRKNYVPDTVSNMLQAGEWYQNETIRRLIQNKDRIPIVVTGGMHIDSVPNEMRTYRIAEYVYTNYRPVGYIDNFEIWLRNDLKATGVQDIRIQRDFNLKELPYIWGTFDGEDPATHQPIQSILFNGELSVDSRNPAVFTNISPYVAKDTGNYILLKLKTANLGDIMINYGNDANNLSGKPATMKFVTIPSDKPQIYLVRISAQWDWYANQISYICLTPTVPITLYDCKILKGD